MDQWRSKIQKPGKQPPLWLLQCERLLWMFWSLHKVSDVDRLRSEVLKVIRSEKILAASMRNRRQIFQEWRTNGGGIDQIWGEISVPRYGEPCRRLTPNRIANMIWGPCFPVLSASSMDQWQSKIQKLGKQPPLWLLQCERLLWMFWSLHKVSDVDRLRSEVLKVIRSEKILVSNNLHNAATAASMRNSRQIFQEWRTNGGVSIHEHLKCLIKHHLD